jgi:hypothetical protein
VGQGEEEVSETPSQRRKRENADLIKRMKAGESLARIPASATWFQPRPVVKKDQRAITKLFGEDDK